MTVEGWQLAAAALGIVGAAGAAARVFFAGIESRITDARKEAADALAEVRVDIGKRRDQLDKTIADHDARLRSSEQSDTAHKQQFSDLYRRVDDDARRVAESNGKLSSTVMGLANDVRGLLVAFGKVEERLDLKREILGRYGRRVEDKDEPTP